MEGSLTPQKVSINDFTALVFATPQTLCSASADTNGMHALQPIRRACVGFCGYTAWQTRIVMATCEKHTARSVDLPSNGVGARSVLHWNIQEHHYELIWPVMLEEEAAMMRLSLL